ncbi:hypothetical protein C8Q80DRAFT_586752 [Daedaleopsis nitida]|nr:hypothetical protein C8Q80DRAFT_586752 [Daedaleopsis nitida]
MARDGQPSTLRKNKPATCPICSVLVNRDLDRHMKLHSPPRLACPFRCGKHVRQMSNLMSHIHAKHLEDRPWKCPYTIVAPTGGRVPCSEAFNSPSGLTKHKQNVHARDPPPAEKATSRAYGFDLSDPAQRVLLHNLVTAIKDPSHPVPAPARTPPPPMLHSPSLELPAHGGPAKQEEVNSVTTGLPVPEPSQPRPSEAQHPWMVPDPAPSLEDGGTDDQLPWVDTASTSLLRGENSAPAHLNFLRYTYPAERAVRIPGQEVYMYQHNHGWSIHGPQSCVPDQAIASPSGTPSSDLDHRPPDNENVFDKFIQT